MDDRNRNQLLACLPDADWDQIASRLKWVELQAGNVLYNDNSPVEHVYFPTTAVVSLVSTLTDGAQAEVAVVGNEGFVGVCAFMDGCASLSSAVVQTTGRALRMSGPAIREESRRMDALMQHMMRYTQALFIHMARGSVCIRHHSLDQQLARWLLLHDDRIDGAEMQITQECIAHTLGVRRESITGCAMKLQLAGVISYRRGHLTILSRSGLEDRCCECYPLVKNAYDRLANDCKSASQSSTYTHDTKICNQDPALKRYA